MNFTTTNTTTNVGFSQPTSTGTTESVRIESWGPTTTITKYDSPEEENAMYALSSFTERYFLAKNKGIFQGFQVFQVTSIQGYDKFDFVATRYGADFVGEIKIRLDRKFNFWEGALCEIQKYDSLMKVYQDTGMEPIYVSFWGDGTVTIQNLLSHKNPQVKIISCPSTTVGNGSYRDKRCYLLPYNNGTELYQYQIPDKEEIQSKFSRKYIRQSN